MKTEKNRFEAVTLNIKNVIQSEDNFPQKSGIYFVYIVYIDNNNPAYKLIYIGESHNMYERHHPHDKYEEFKKEAKKVKGLIIYSYVLVENKIQREEIQAALIRKIKPLLNTQNIDGYTGRPYVITIEGHRYSLNHIYVVLPDNN